VHRLAIGLAVAALAVVLAPAATGAAKRCPLGYKKVGSHCTRAVGPPPRGFADTYQGRRGTLRVQNVRGQLSARLSWRVTLVCSDKSKMPSARGIQDGIRLGKGRSFTMSGASTLGTASFAGRWRNRNTVSGTLRIDGFPGEADDVTCAGQYAGSFSFKRRRRA
jgi:hypothetical protein